MTIERTDVPAAWDERTMLDTFLDYVRATVHAKCEGLSEADAHATPLPGSPKMSPAALVNHVRWVETDWIRRVLLGQEIDAPWTAEDPDGEFTVAADIPLADLLADYTAAAEGNRALVAGLDLDTTSVGTLRDGSRVTLRWVLFHLIEETARHNGHLDIVRELIDGTTGD